MAGNAQVLDVTYEAGEDLSSSQYRVVVQGDSDNTCKLPGAAGEGKVLGILQNDPESGEAARVRKLGISTVEADNTAAGLGGNRGDAIEIAAATGTVRKYTGASDNCCVGYAEEDFAKGDKFRMFINIIDLTVL